MSVHDPARLQRLLGGPEWAWLRRRLRRAFERGAEWPLAVANVRPTPDERRAANRLLGKPGAVGPIRVRVGELVQTLREACVADDLGSCLEALDGPLVNRRTEATLERQRWEEVHEQARIRLGAWVSTPAVLERLAATGLWRRLAAGDATQAISWLDDLVAVAAGLHERRDWLLAELAAVTTGDAHALDRGRALGSLSLRLFGAAGGNGEGGEGVLAWREAWHRLGVRTDDLSAPVLCLNLGSAHRGEPQRVTARALRTGWTAAGLACSAGGAVFVCENPAVVAAAADRLGAASAPLVCMEGQPGTAVLLLLAQLRASGSHLRYHGDADWPGIAIANAVHEQFGFRPWRFDAAAIAAAEHLPGPPLAGSLVEAAWDPQLGAALVARGRALHEEAMLHELLHDLAPTPS